MQANLTISLLGNPNCGKTAIFNLLTGLNQKVSNYPGITVEKKIAQFKINDNLKISVEDYPGAYSLIPQSLDEKIVFNSCIQWIKNDFSKPDAIVYVADVTNLKRNIYFLSQLQSFNIPIILLLNMADLVNVRDVVDVEKLGDELGLCTVIPFSASTKEGLSDLFSVLQNVKKIKTTKNPSIPLSENIIDIVKPIKNSLQKSFDINNSLANELALMILCNDNLIKQFNFNKELELELSDSKNKVISNIDSSMSTHIVTMETDLRYGYLDKLLDSCNYQEESNVAIETNSEKIDKILTHVWMGPIIYIGLLYFVFQSIFTYATIPMDFIDSLVSSFGNYVSSYLPDSWYRSLIVDGIIAGFGGIVIFLPQILLLMLFMILLEDTGYMTRIAFLFDKFMRKVGLHGKSILPIMSGYACAIPGIISARTIDSWKERLITILILPLISCSARLPVYVLMISAFIPDIYIYDFIGLQGLMMVVMYFLGTITAFILAIVFSRFLSEKSNPSFIMELPSYRIPIISSVFKQLLNRGKLFLINAGKIIMTISIILWFLVSYPKNEYGENQISTSYAGKIGHLIEPTIKPLGFDWKIGIGLITSFAAREVVVSTLATIYNVSDEQETMVDLKEAMKSDVNSKTGENVFNPVVAVSLMVFYVFAAQCVATFAVVRTETNTWKWPIFMIVYMTSLAYLASLLVYQFGKNFI